MSPVAGGGYPWFNNNDPNSTFNPTLMIRPRFLPQTLVSTEAEPTEANELLVYPNPFTDELTVHLLFPTDQSLPLQIFDMTGRQVFSSQIQGNIPARLGLESLSQGVYILRVWDGNRVVVKKVVRQ